TLKPPLLVALRPTTSQLSIHSTDAAGTRKMRNAVPPGTGTGAPFLSNTGAIRPIQVACRLPLEKPHSPFSRWPPSISSARDLLGGPHRRAGRAPPKLWPPPAGPSAPEGAAQPLIWPPHHGVLPSSLASPSTARNHVTSPPPPPP